MTNEQVIEAAVEVMNRYSQDSVEYEVAVFAMHYAMRQSHTEALMQLVNGPVYDGDLVSKACRDDLLRWGLATKVCVKGEQGFNGANYRGYEVLKAGR